MAKDRGSHRKTDFLHRDADPWRREEQRDLYVVFQMLADIWRIDETGYANTLEFASRSNSGKKEQVRRTNGAGAQDHFLACEGHADLPGRVAILDSCCLDLSVRILQ